jgi:hypothetical protein
MDPSAIPGKREPAKGENAPTIHLSPEQNRERRPFSGITGGRIEVFREFGPRLPILMFQRITPEFAYQSVPKPTSADDLL